jgi:hypothetical protein
MHYLSAAPQGGTTSYKFRMFLNANTDFYRFSWYRLHALVSQTWAWVSVFLQTIRDVTLTMFPWKWLESSRWRRSKYMAETDNWHNGITEGIATWIALRMKDCDGLPQICLLFEMNHSGKSLVPPHFEISRCTRCKPCCLPGLGLLSKHCETAKSIPNHAGTNYKKQLAYACSGQEHTIQMMPSNLWISNLVPCSTSCHAKAYRKPSSCHGWSWCQSPSIRCVA